MSSFWNFVFGVILIILWIIAGVFITQASIYLTPYKDRDDLLHRAYIFCFWAAFVTWFLIALFILLIVLSVVGVVALFGSGVGEAAEAGEIEESRLLTQNNLSEQGISWFTIAFLVFALILIGVTGVLSAIAATSMTESSNFNNNVVELATAYRDCIISASVCLGAGSLLIIGMVIYFVVGYEKEQKVKLARQTELGQIDQLKQQGLRKRLQQREEFNEQLLLAKQENILQEVVQEKNNIKTSSNIKPISSLPKVSNKKKQVPISSLPKVSNKKKQVPIQVIQPIRQNNINTKQLTQQIKSQAISSLTKYLNK